MLEVRRITAEEVTQARKISTVVFNFRGDYTKEAAPDPLDHPPEWTWAAFEGGKMASSMVEIEYVMRFDGHDAKMSGIGGVGTLPEERRGGKVREIFLRLLPEAYERGVVFSNLTPFSHAFYRKFGYELCCARNEIQVETRVFEKSRLRGEFTQFFPGGDTAVLQEVHAAYIADLNHGIRRDVWPDDRAWRSFTRDDPYQKGSFLYVWRNAAGEPRGYIKYQHEFVEGKNRMNVRELAFLDTEALYAIFSLVGGLSAQIDTLIWMAPTFLDPADFADVSWDVRQRIVPRDMTRIVNVRAALELMRRPEGEGVYVVEVSDPIIGANAGRWLVEYGPEGSRVTATQKDADLRCDMPTLAQLVTGYRTLGNALRTSRAQLELCGGGARGSRVATLHRVFTQRPQHVTEYF
ncbi:MAG: GNAT family N-acetyltransferase [Clostridiales bacterium]|jgi:predicted acetyltransferase|nr:GNAT family N-acetyltransferase [Clostridiales bacterium]